jgi:FtsZ-binding cell division protein ZapB
MSDNNATVPQWRYEVLEAKCERQEDEIELLKAEIEQLKKYSSVVTNIMKVPDDKGGQE